LWNDRITPPWLAVTITMFQAADIAEKQSASRGAFTVFAEDSFSSGHVTDPLMPSVRNLAPGERLSP
jgi:hypothetical protein